MNKEFSIELKRSAVLIMDYQKDIVDLVSDAQQERLLHKSADVLAAARRAGLPIIYVTVGFRAGYPEISPRNMMFSGIKNSGRLAPGSAGADVHPAVTPGPGDSRVVKHRVGAFAGTDLNVILRAKNIDTLVLFGIATSGVVLSTVRYAADEDYRLIVLADCSADPDADVHTCLMEKVFTRQATVIDSQEFIQRLDATI